MGDTAPTNPGPWKRGEGDVDARSGGFIAAGDHEELALAGGIMSIPTESVETDRVSVVPSLFSPGPLIPDMALKMDLLALVHALELRVLVRLATLARDE